MDKEKLKEIALKTQITRSQEEDIASRRSRLRNRLQKQIDNLEAERLYLEIEAMAEEAAAQELTSLTALKIEPDLTRTGELTRGLSYQQSQQYINELLQQEDGPEQILGGPSKKIYERLKKRGF